MFSTGISLSPNWDKNGKVFYTDENGEVVRPRVNHIQNLSNQLKVLSMRLGQSLNNINQERSKTYYAPFEDINEQYKKSQ